jgi:hypothetical protein
MAKDQELSEAEIARRADAALRVALNTPPIPHETMKIGERKKSKSSKGTKEATPKR